ncbi:nucleobase:cation symporter-2 family protein [Clostridium cylindrosporum]|uniref:Xanthine permease PbuX n=1 Tax=Clostridium cylindrosporum DSM 605 TaxID=1121307 RepID=A0A0J8G339_CLOCY|nr:nucleobase:cation symporter-2 family protein [Clostridium cylindrosporum]KMT22116.1 xanthine permease PbuX [Clostridium cylindrosporum DSM 605]
MQTQSIDKLNEKLPVSQLIPLGLQHVLAMYAGAVIVPIIVGQGIGLNPKQLAYLVAADLFTCGIATLIQTLGILNFAGIRLPVVLGCAFQAVFPMISIGKDYGIEAIYGSIISSGIFVLFAAYFFGKLLKFFPPVVIGSIITIIGLSLIGVAFNNLGGGAQATASKTFGSLQNIGIGIFTLLIIILSNKFFKGFMQTISVLIGIISGTILAYLAGIVSLDNIVNEPWLNIVTPFYFGFPKFVPAAIFTLCLVSLVSMIESTGVFFATGNVCEKKIEEKDIVKGIRAEGIAQVLGGIFNAFPYTTFSQNVGLIALTKVRSRYVVVSAGIILIILGTIPKFAAIATIIPPCVLGGAMIALFGMVAISGIKTLSVVDFTKTSNMLIAACSIAVGLGVSITPDLFAFFPKNLKLFFESGIVSGSIVAILLNILLNWNELKGNVKPEMVLPDEHSL